MVEHMNKHNNTYGDRMKFQIVYVSGPQPLRLGGPVGGNGNQAAPATSWRALIAQVELCAMCAHAGTQVEFCMCVRVLGHRSCVLVLNRPPPGSVLRLRGWGLLVYVERYCPYFIIWILI